MNQLLNDQGDQNAITNADPKEARQKILQMLESGQITREELQEKWSEAERIARNLGLI